MQFYVNVGEGAHGFGKEEHDTFETWVFRTGSTININMFPEGNRHHAGTLKIDSGTARWLAYALLSATDGGEDAHPLEMRVEDGAIVSRTIRREP